MLNSLNILQYLLGGTRNPTKSLHQETCCRKMNSSGANVFIMLIFFISPFFFVSTPRGSQLFGCKKMKNPNPFVYTSSNCLPGNQKRPLGINTTCGERCLCQRITPTKEIGHWGPHARIHQNFCIPESPWVGPIALGSKSSFSGSLSKIFEWGPLNEKKCI